MTSLTLLILSTACGQYSAGPSGPSSVDTNGTATLTGMVAQATPEGFSPVDGAIVELLLDDSQAVARSGKNAARPADAVVVSSAITGVDGRFEFNNVTY